MLSMFEHSVLMQLYRRPAFGDHSAVRPQGGCMMGSGGLDMFPLLV